MVGFALHLAQTGSKHPQAKVLKGFGCGGVLEVVEDDFNPGERSRARSAFAVAVYVLHCFQKKSNKGIATPKQEIDLIHARLKLAELDAKGHKK